MARFHELTVTNIEKTIKDAVVVTLSPPDTEAFDFIQGQDLTFRRDFGETEVRRSYSICIERGSPQLRVGIKQIAGGALSTWAKNDLQVRDTLENAQSPAPKTVMREAPIC